VPPDRLGAASNRRAGRDPVGMERAFASTIRPNADRNSNGNTRRGTWRPVLTPTTSLSSSRISSLRSPWAAARSSRSYNSALTGVAWKSGGSQRTTRAASRRPRHSGGQRHVAPRGDRDQLYLPDVGSQLGHDRDEVVDIIRQPVRARVGVAVPVPRRSWPCQPELAPV
jgi:hypothetical protein